jgi:hypothetical protein
VHSSQVGLLKNISNVTFSMTKELVIHQLLPSKLKLCNNCFKTGHFASGCEAKEKSCKKCYTVHQPHAQCAPVKCPLCGDSHQLHLCHKKEDVRRQCVPFQSPKPPNLHSPTSFPALSSQTQPTVGSWAKPNQSLVQQAVEHFIKGLSILKQIAPSMDILSLVSTALSSAPHAKNPTTGCRPVFL